MSLKLTLEHTPASSIRGGYHARCVDPAGPSEVSVRDVEEARVLFCLFIGRNSLSGSNLPEGSGVVRKQDGEEVGRVRFSGVFVPAHSVL